MLYEPNLYLLEIAITYICNVRCSNCCTLSTQAPTRHEEDMSVEDVRRFVRESVEIQYPWKWIKLHGGEPTIHPEYESICGVLVEYRNKYNSSCELSVCSNGSRPDKVDYALRLGFTPQVSVKVGSNIDGGGTRMPYVCVNESPADIGLESVDCHVPKDCGLGLDKRGLWPCAPMAGAARVFGYEPACRSVCEIAVAKLELMLAHCRHCGFSVSRPRSFDPVTTPTWADKLKEYNATH